MPVLKDSPTSCTPAISKLHFVFSTTNNFSAPTVLFLYITGQGLLFSHYIHLPFSHLLSTIVNVQHVKKKTIVTYSDHQWQLFQFLSLSDYNGHLVPAQNGYNAGMNIKSWQHGSYVWICITVLTSQKYYPVESNLM